MTSSNYDYLFFSCTNFNETKEIDKYIILMQQDIGWSPMRKEEKKVRKKLRFKKKREKRDYHMD
jgi:hypothetical protein